MRRRRSAGIIFSDHGCDAYLLYAYFLVMKATCILLTLVVMVATQGFAQLHDRAHGHLQWNGLGVINGTNYWNSLGGHCGVYSSATDRASGRLSLAINCRVEDHKIKPGFVGDRAAIKVIRQDAVHRFPQRDLYGYRDCNGREYHFFNGKVYELLNPGEPVPIYRTYQQRGPRRVARFFFATSSGNIKPLTLEHLQTAFRHEPLFLEKLSILAANNFELVKHRHAINRVRMNTLKEL